MSVSMNGFAVQPMHVVGCELPPLPRGVDHPLRGGCGALDGLRRATQREHLTAQGDAHPAEPGQFDEIAVVHASECQQIGAFGVEPQRNRVVTHSGVPSTWMCNSARSWDGTGAGAPSNNARAAVVLGNAMTS